MILPWGFPTTGPCVHGIVLDGAVIRRLHKSGSEPLQCRRRRRISTSTLARGVSLDGSLIVTSRYCAR